MLNLIIHSHAKYFQSCFWMSTWCPIELAQFIKQPHWLFNIFLTLTRDHCSGLVRILDFACHSLFSHSCSISVKEHPNFLLSVDLDLKRASIVLPPWVPAEGWRGAACPALRPPVGMWTCSFARWTLSWSLSHGPCTSSAETLNQKIQGTTKAHTRYVHNAHVRTGLFSCVWGKCRNIQEKQNKTQGKANDCVGVGAMGNSWEARWRWWWQNVCVASYSLLMSNALSVVGAWIVDSKNQ